MAIRIGINGFGRIGRLVYRIAHARKDIDIVAINDITDAPTLAYLLKYDSVHKKFTGKVEAKEDFIIVDGKKSRVLAEKDPEKLPWKDLGAEYIIESTGVFRKKEQLEKHLKAGAKKVLLSVPSKDEIDATIILEVNDNVWKPCCPGKAYLLA